MHVDTNGTVGSVLLLHSNSITNGTITTRSISTGSATFTYPRIDSATPFSLCGDTNTSITVPTLSSSFSKNRTMNIIDYAACTFLSTEGQHTITVVPYLKRNATGRSGLPFTVTFNVLNRNTKVRHCKVPKVRCNGTNLNRFFSWPSRSFFYFYQNTSYLIVPTNENLVF